jgi:Bacterial dnaA protein helix-turn-helix
VSPEDMIYGVATAHGCTVRELAGRSRHARVTRARHEAMWLLREATDLSLPDVGRILGNRDHTTVLSGVRKIQRIVEVDPYYGETIRARARASAEGVELLRLQRRAAALQAQATALQGRIDEATKRLTETRAA